MKTIEIEAWALRVLERVEARQPVEDSKVELKSEWPTDIGKTARQIAGHANFARGECILWIIGVDEAEGIVVGANQQELANWFPKIQSAFDGIAPTLANLNIPYKSKTVAALCFDTSRFPYLVKNPAGGPIQFEVPWREGNKTRTATRSDLILLLSPLVRIPKLNVLAGELRFIAAGPHTGPSCLQFLLTCYVVALDGVAITFPIHQCSAALTVENATHAETFKVRLSTASAEMERKRALIKRFAVAGVVTADPSPTQIHVQTDRNAIQATADELVIRGSGQIQIVGETPILLASLANWPEVHLRITLVEAVTEFQVALNVKMVKNSPDPTLFVWCVAK